MERLLHSTLTAETYPSTGAAPARPGSPADPLMRELKQAIAQMPAIVAKRITATSGPSRGHLKLAEPSPKEKAMMWKEESDILFRSFFRKILIARRVSFSVPFTLYLSRDGRVRLRKIHPHLLEIEAVFVDYPDMRNLFVELNIHAQCAAAVRLPSVLSERHPDAITDIQVSFQVEKDEWYWDAVLTEVVSF